MITKNHIIFCAPVLLCLLLFAGCSKTDTHETANELRFSLTDVSDITISYDEEDITFYDSDDDTLIIKEYMTVKKKSYFAKVKQRKNSLHISEGGKPIFKGDFNRHTEIYLPLSYQNNLSITTTDGNINLSDIDLNVSDLQIDSTSGTVQVSHAQADQMHLSSTSGTFKLGSLTAESISIKTTSGNVMCKEIDGSVTYTSTSGNAEFQSAIGFGRFTAENSGRLSVCYTNVDGDLMLFNKNDNINLVLPEKLEFEFEAITKNGAISTNFQKQIEIDGDKTIGTVGDNPTSTVRVETKNGNITAVVGICH